MSASTYTLEWALLPDGVAADVRVQIEDGKFTSVEAGATGRGERVTGLTLPGVANCHSHAFHRALRGRTQRERGTFWTWREQMYAVAERLNPDSYYRLARATYAEMLAAGYTAVGEFHYLHHQAGGMTYDDPNAMGHALISAAQDVGIRITLLDTCYLSSGFGAAPTQVQRRFSDDDASRWATRVEALVESDGVRIGAAIHSVRAVPTSELPTVVRAATDRPLHVHLSEQRAENEDCLAATGRTPTQLLADVGALGPLTSAVHATHLSAEDIALLGQSSTTACFCPTTERDLGDGIGPSRALLEAGARLSIGSDSHAVIDAFEELRALELNERLAAEARGHWSAGELMGVANGHASLGFEDAGAIAVGRRADLVTVDLTTSRTAGGGPTAETAIFAAGSADVRRVVADGRVVFDGGAETRAALGRALDASIREVLGD